MGWQNVYERVNGNVYAYLNVCVCVSGPEALSGLMRPCLIHAQQHQEWMHTEVEVCASVSVCWGLISTLDVLILSVLQRHAATC